MRDRETTNEVEKTEIVNMLLKPTKPLTFY